MSYDIKVLSVGASCKLDISCGSITAKRTVDFEQDFVQHYTFAAKMRGEWFELKKDGAADILDTAEICELDREHGGHELFWRQENPDTGHYSLLIRSEELFDDLRLIMKQLRKLSPSATLVFLARMRDHEKNDVCGVLTLDEFMALIPEKKVYSNLCYIIED